MNILDLLPASPFGWIQGAIVAAALAAAVTYHFVKLNAQYELGAVDARQKCSADAKVVRSAAEEFYQRRAERLEKELNALRMRDEKTTAEDQRVFESLEADLGRQKDDPVCWAPSTVKEISK